MATLLNSSTYSKVFFADYQGLNGTLAKLDDNRVYFYHETSGQLIEVTDLASIQVLGEVGLAMAAYCLDEMRGGLAKIACTRANLEVR